MKHWDLLLSNQVDKKTFIDRLLSGSIHGELAGFEQLKGILFSDISIQNLIEEEFVHQSMEATAQYNRNLRSFSSGERKKEFLKYCLKKEPQYIILDNPMDHLDQKSRLELSKAIEDIAKRVIIIQLVNRRIDLLPFIENKARIEDNSFELKPIDNPASITNESNSRQLPIHSEIFAQSTLVQMNGVWVSYEDRPIIAPLDWTIQQGEFWHLVGPNGSGKSTLLSLISGENPKAYGQDLILFGRKKGSGESIWDIKKKIGFYNTAMMDLFHKSSKNFSLEEMILSGFFDSIGLYIQPTTLQKKIAEQWLQAIEMTSLKKKIFDRLSIGQQRVALIARAAIKHPPLLILDEPLEGLDDHNTELVCRLIRLIQKETNISILFVSHRMEPNLCPDAILELHPSPNGSTAIVKRLKK